MDPSPSAIVRLERPFALGHGLFSSSRIAVLPGLHGTIRGATAFDQVLLVPARTRLTGRCRATDNWRFLEGTEITSAGQTTGGTTPHWQFARVAPGGWHRWRNLLASRRAGQSRATIR